MGKGQRHSKNAGVMGSESLTYWEKRQLGFGTAKERLGKDSLGNFDDCCLTLQPVVDPMCCPKGYIFSKEAIYSNLLDQKKVYKTKLLAWQQQQDQQKQRDEEQKLYENHAQLIAFDRQNNMGASEKMTKQISTILKDELEQLHGKKVIKSQHNIGDNERRAKEMKAFWLPSMTPEAQNKVDKPNSETVCPIDGERMRLKDLTKLDFTEAPEDTDARFMDPITLQQFTNSSKLVALKPSGVVMLKSSYEKFVKPDGNYNGEPISQSDVIELQGGGTGYAAHDKNKTDAKKYFHLGPGSGLSDLRGQHSGPRSHGGLSFNN